VSGARSGRLRSENGAERWVAEIHVPYLKNVPPLACCKFDTHEPIVMIFGTNVNEKVKRSKGVLFSHLT